MEAGLAALRGTAKQLLHVRYAEASTHVAKGFYLLVSSKVNKVVAVCLQRGGENTTLINSFTTHARPYNPLTAEEQLEKSSSIY